MSKENKKIETKNYIILGIIVIVTVLVVFYMRNIYIMSKVYYSDNAVMLDVVKEVKQEELPNYLIENPKFILYVSSSQNKDIRGFEKTLKSTVTKAEIEDSILYLDSDNSNIPKLKEELQKNASKKVQDNINKNSVVTIYIIENGKVTNIINDAEKLSKQETKTLLKKYGVIENA